MRPCAPARRAAPGRRKQHIYLTGPALSLHIFPCILVSHVSHPQGRTAYLQWREDLKRQHAATTTRLMAEAGYPPEACKRVETLILKRALKELEGQIVEDSLCLGGCLAMYLGG